MGLWTNFFSIYWNGMVEGSAHALLPGQWNSYRQFEKFIMPDGAAAVLRTVADPPGFYIPYAYHPPILAGEMSMRTDGDGDLIASLVPSRSMTIDLIGSGTLTATAALAIAMAIAMTGAGTLTAIIEGRLNASIAMTGSGGLTANLSALGNMVIAMLGAGDLDATIAAYGNMEIDIVVTGAGLSTANVGQAVWAALAASNNDPGTMGEKLNDAGSASNPWTEVIESGFTAAQILRLLAAVVQGNATGLENGNPIFKGLDGTTNRVEGTYVDGVRVITDRDAD